jgi:peptide/nickel transport system permease protein
VLGTRSGAVGAALVALVVAIAVLAPWLERRDPLEPDIDGGLSELGAPLPPSADAPLGTDALGRDVWSRVVAGAARSLAIAAAATLVVVALGLAIGLCAGYAGGRVDAVLMRFVDLILAFPFLLFAILVAAMLRESDAVSPDARVIVTLGAVGWTSIARVVRAKVLGIARSDYVTAARALGAGPARVVLRHVLPNVAGLAIALAALAFAQNMLAESALSYLGLGAPPPAPTWGRMLFEAREYYRAAPWLAIAPGVAIVVAVVGFNLLAAGLREAVAGERA